MEWPPLLDSLFKGESSATGLNAFWYECFFTDLFGDVPIPFVKVVVMWITLVCMLLLAQAGHSYNHWFNDVDKLFKIYAKTQDPTIRENQKDLEPERCETNEIIENEGHVKYLLVSTPDGKKWKVGHLCLVLQGYANNVYGHYTRFSVGDSLLSDEELQNNSQSQNDSSDCKTCKIKMHAEHYEERNEVEPNEMDAWMEEDAQCEGKAWKLERFVVQSAKGLGVWPKICPTECDFEGAEVEETLCSSDKKLRGQMLDLLQQLDNGVGAIDNPNFENLTKTTLQSIFGDSQVTPGSLTTATSRPLPFQVLERTRSELKRPSRRSSGGNYAKAANTETRDEMRWDNRWSTAYVIFYLLNTNCCLDFINAINCHMFWGEGPIDNQTGFYGGSYRLLKDSDVHCYQGDSIMWQSLAWFSLIGFVSVPLYHMKLMEDTFKAESFPFLKSFHFRLPWFLYYRYYYHCWQEKRQPNTANSVLEAAIESEDQADIQSALSEHGASGDPELVAKARAECKRIEQVKNRARFDRQFAFLFRAFRSEYLWWGIAVALRRLMITGVVIVASKYGALMQISLSLFLVTVFLVMHVACYPFAYEDYNRLETVSLSANFVSLSATLAVVLEVTPTRSV